MKRLPEDKNKQRGSILLMVLVVISLGFVVAISLIQISMTQQQTVRYEDYSLRAYYAAEAGIEDAIPRLQEAMNLAGADLDEYLTNPLNQVTLAAPIVLDAQSGVNYQFDRSVQRAASAPLIERTIGGDVVTQFDLSDLEGESLEESWLGLAWEDASCGSSGCDAAVEVTLFSKISRTTNLAFNPSFELPAAMFSDPAQPWKNLSTTDATYSLETDPAEVKFGVQSAHMQFSAITGPAVEDNSFASHIGIERKPASRIPINSEGIVQTYTLSAYVMVSGFSGEVRIAAVEYDGAGTQIPTQGHRESRFQSGHSYSRWERIYVEFETSPATRYLNPVIFLTSGVAGQVWIDGVQLEQGTLTPYCDGDQGYGSFGDCRWGQDGTGTPHLSESWRDNIYTIERYFYDPRETAVPNSGYDPGINRSGGGTRIENINLPVTYPSNSRILRVRPLFAEIDFEVTAHDNAFPPNYLDLPGQEIEITSKGYFADTEKAISLKRSLPTILPQFDYVLYNHGCAEGTGCVPRDLVK